MDSRPGRLEATIPLPVRVEIIPGRDIVSRLQAYLPAPAVVTITCLPHHGPSETVDLAVRLADLGYRAVPHLAARSVESRSQLAGMVTRLTTADVRDIFVIAGDAAAPDGPYAWSHPLMEDIANLSGGSIAIGVAAYPEGHPAIPQPELMTLLLKKQELASWAVTQMCFSGPVLASYAELLTSQGVTIPLWAGVPGAVRRSRLFALAGRIGVGPSLKFAQRSGPLLRNVLASSSYNPAPLVRSVEESGAFAGLHIYSFNDVETLGRS